MLKPNWATGITEPLATMPASSPPPPMQQPPFNPGQPSTLSPHPTHPSLEGFGQDPEQWLHVCSDLLAQAGVFVPKTWNGPTRQWLHRLQLTPQGQTMWRLLHDDAFQARCLGQDGAALATLQQAQEELLALLQGKTGSRTSAPLLEAQHQGQTSTMQMMMYVMYVLQQSQQSLLQGIQDAFAQVQQRQTILQAMNKYSKILQDKAEQLAQRQSQASSEEQRSQITVPVEIHRFPITHTTSPTQQVYVQKNKEAPLTSLALDHARKQATNQEQQMNKDIERIYQRITHLYTQAEQNMAMLNSFITSHLRAGSKIAENIR